MEQVDHKVVPEREMGLLRKDGQFQNEASDTAIEN
jgi:hypothetical protein